MKETVSDYIAARIRCLPPAGVPVVPGSTPVVAFGDVTKAWIATLGLNPSKIEFLDRDGIELAGDKRRLETLKTLGVSELSAASDTAVLAVLTACHSYFQRRPYRWFNRLERVLRQVGSSYYDGSACHLDLAQWATDPTWSGLSRSQRQSLLSADIPFLQQQLARENIELLLLNGTAILKECVKRLGVPLTGAITMTNGRVRMFTGRAASGLHVVGWNLNLQSAFGVTNEEIDFVGRSVQTLALEKNLPQRRQVQPSGEPPSRERVEAFFRSLPKGKGGWLTEAGVLRLLKLLDESGLTLNFDWIEWQDEAARYVADSAILARGDLITLRRLLTLHMRKERFCEGHFDEMVRCGHIQAVLQRLADLYGLHSIGGGPS